MTSIGIGISGVTVAFRSYSSAIRLVDSLLLVRWGWDGGERMSKCKIVRRTSWSQSEENEGFTSSCPPILQVRKALLDQFDRLPLRFLVHHSYLDKTNQKPSLNQKRVLWSQSPCLWGLVDIQIPTSNKVWRSCSSLSSNWLRWSSSCVRSSLVCPFWSGWKPGVEWGPVTGEVVEGDICFWLVVLDWGLHRLEYWMFRIRVGSGRGGINNPKKSLLMVIL